MRKILLFTGLLAGLCATAQLPKAPLPVKQTLGSKQTLVVASAGLGADSVFVLPAYTDTIRANYGANAKYYSGDLIRTGDSVWMRDKTTTKWLLIYATTKVGVDTIYQTAGKDSIQFTIGGRYHAIKDSVGSVGATYYNSNIGSGYRWVIPNTNNIKTVFVTPPVIIDSSSNTNALTIGLDTSSGKWRSENYYNTVFTPLIRSISTGYGLTGGGNFTVNRTHILDSATVFQAVINTIALTTIGTGAATWNPSARILNIPTFTETYLGTVTSVTATSPITSTGGATPNISTSMNTNKLIGRGTAAVGVMEEITLGTNLSLSGTTLNGANQLQTLAVTGTTTGITTLSNSGGSMTIAGAGINTIGVSGSTITITGTEAFLGTLTDFIYTDGHGLDGTVTLSTTTPTLSIVSTVPNTQVMWSNNGDFSGITGVTSDGTNMTAGSGNLRATRPRITTSIDDISGNKIIGLSTTGTPVNYISISNADAGSNPTITSTGSDTNIGMNFETKGNTPWYLFNATSAAPTSIFLYEQTTNGSNYVGFKSPASLANSNMYVLPVDYPSVTGYVLSSTTSGTTSWVNGTEIFSNSSDATTHDLSLSTAAGINSTLTFIEGAGISLTTGGSSTYATLTIATTKTLDAGTYTPSLTNAENISSSTAYECQWLRVGNTVTVSGKVSFTATTGSLTTRLGISLPVASSLAQDYQVGGAANSGDNTVPDGAVKADAANDRAELSVILSEATSCVYWFTFTYLIVPAS